jgi:hypothetical protein
MIPGTEQFMPRPRPRTAEIHRLAAIQCAGVLTDGDGLNDDEVRVIVDALADGCEDAYELAKILDDRGWDVDKSFVDACEELIDECSTIHREMVRKWVIETKQKCPYAIGTPVRVETIRGTFDGEISALYEDCAQMVVMCPSAGHVRSGLGTHGFVFDYEDERVRRIDEAANNESSGATGQ